VQVLPARLAVLRRRQAGAEENVAARAEPAFLDDLAFAAQPPITSQPGEFARGGSGADGGCGGGCSEEEGDRGAHVTFPSGGGEDRRRPQLRLVALRRADLVSLRRRRGF